METTVVVHFDQRLRETTHEAFVAMIAARAPVAGLLMTPDAAFGYRRAGTPATLAVLGARQGFEVIVVPPFELDGRPVRSTEVRAAIASGDLARAAQLLGRSHCVAGMAVARSAGQGSLLRFPLPVALPPDGTYPVEVGPVHAGATDEAVIERVRCAWSEHHRHPGSASPSAEMREPRVASTAPRSPEYVLRSDKHREWQDAASRAAGGTGGTGVSEAFFTEVTSPIRFGGLDSTDPLTFKVYQPDRHGPGQADGGSPPARGLLLALVRLGRAATCSASARWTGRGSTAADEMAGARMKMAAAFEFFAKLGIPYYCFHDRDVAPEGDSFAEFRDNLDALVDDALGYQERTGVRLLWGTANLFSHPRYLAGAATNPDPEVFAYAAAQVKHMLEVTQRLGGENYVLWGGREGYDTLLNTDLQREGQQLARFLHLVAEHKAKIGFKGQLLIEPKPMEPTKHQYDYDTASRPRLPRPQRPRGPVQVSTSRPTTPRSPGTASTTRWRTPSRTACWAPSTPTAATPRTAGTPTSSRTRSRTWRCRCTRSSAAAASAPGGFNFDAKLRRQSTDRTDLFHAHIGGLDTIARALLVAADLVERGELAANKDARYAGWDGDLGAAILGGGTSLADLEARVASGEIDPQPVSGGQERLENVVNRSIWAVDRTAGG